MSKSGYVLMGLLCVVPVVAFAAIFLFNLPVSPVILLALALACPLSHLLFLGTMRRDEQVESRPTRSVMARK